MSIKSRRIIALLLCFVMVFTAMPVSAFAVEDSVGQVTEQSESEAVVSPDDVSADIDEQTTTEDNPTADVDNEPAVEDETPAVEEETPAVEEETPAVEDETPAVEEETPAVEDETPAVEEETPAVEDETPAVEEETPAVEEETPAVEEETPAVEDETPAVEEETPAVEDETPAVEEETPAVEDETPAVEEEIPAIDEIPVLGGAITEQYGIMLLNEVMLLGDATGTVYISISYDGKYVNGNNEKPVAYVPVSLSDLQEIDLEDYGLTDYDYNGQLTALHLYIYTHENIMGKEWSEVEVQGSAGSIFFANGLFGFSDCNLQYYYNGEYPADENGWGITADQLVLNNGDFFDIAGYTSWAFYGDSVTGFHYFLDDEEITHEYTATAGEALTVTLGRSNYGMNQVSDYTVSYGDELGAADGTVTTNADGQAEITFDEAGTYYLWVDGGKGNENPDDIVSSPGYAMVTVDEAEDEEPSNSYTVKISEAEELTAGLNYFASVPAEGKDLIIDFGSGTISGAMCQRHCSKRDIWTAGEGSTFIITADKVAAHYCNETQRAKVASDFDLYLTEGSQLIAFYWWTTANLNGSYLYLEILPAEDSCEHETWNDATCTTPKTCANCGATEGDVDPDAHNYVEGVCEYCGASEPSTSYTVKISEAEELTAGLNYFASVPAEGKDLIIDFGSGTISGAMCQRHCSKRDIWTAGEGSTFIITADKVAAHYCNETQRAKVASDFDLYLTEGSQLIAFYWWTTANPNGSYLYLEILPAEGEGGGSEVVSTYSVTLPKNPVGYSVRATSSPTVETGGEFSFKLNIFDEYKKGEDFKVMANGVELTSSGNDTYTIANITENQTVTVEGVVEKTLAEKNVTVNAPAGSVVSSGAFHSYFKYDFVEPLQISTLEDGRVQYIVPATSGVGGFIRVQNPDGVTYWDFGDLTIGKVFDITDEMLFIGSTEYTKDTVYANYEKNGHDTASLYLTANAQGWLDMDTGATHSLNVFRNWIPVSNSTSNTGVSLPDVTYTVVDVNGNASDVVTVTPDANNSCYADIKAVKAGTAIILVSYDAVYNADGEGGKQFSAIWPENTGVIVVTVDAEDADIQTNITVNETANAGGKQILDVEHDILFYVGDEGAEYSFKPEDGCTVTISRSTVGNEMTFNGFTNEGVTVSEDGTVTLSGLTTGAHVVKVEKDGKAAYQVIRAREVSYKLTHSDGTEVTAENPAQPGETITVQFSKLIDPMGKLSGVYNAKYGFRYTGENGDVITITSSSAYGEYYFGSNPARQRFNVTVPTEWSGMTYTFTDGSLKLEGWGSTFGGHRSTTYMTGKEVNTNASGTAGYAAVLPDVVIPVDAEPEVDTTLSTYIFNSDIDGTGWGRAGAAYADKLSLFGAGVDALRWDGDTCYVTLDKKTESNAGLGFLITYKATMDSWLDGLKATVNGESMTANEMLFTKLTNGTLTAEVYVTNSDISSQSGTKTFVITVADETACDHEWTEANCTVPKTCKLCGVTRGDIATDGHNYVNDRCEYCGNYVGIEIVTGDTASSSQDIRISDFHINASGSVTSNTISEDGRATVQIKAPLDELELAISMFGKKGMALSKAALAINDGDAVVPTSVDKDNNVAVWIGTVTPEWNGNTAEIKFTVGYSSSVGFKNPKDYILTLEKVEETPDPATYTVTLPTETTGYTVSATEGSASPVTAGGNYSFNVAISDGYEAGENFAVKANDVVLTAVDGVYTIANITADQTVTVDGVVETYPVTVTAPIGSMVSVGTLRSYYIYTFSEPIAAVDDQANGTVTYGFDVPTAYGNSFVRVQHPEGVTYWDYVSMSEGTEINITEDMLFMNDGKHNPDTIIRDLSEYEMDVADVYINANAQGYMPMTIGETHEFNVFRDWHAVEGISNAKTALPDVSYKVIDIDGNESDIVSIVPDENNSSVATMTANEEGTAIVLVTYDAMYSTLALRGGIGTDPAEPAFFSAIWPENTGVLVVTVGSDGSDIQTNMTLNGHALDAEHDVFYYLGAEGASYSFKPDSGSQVSVARAALTEDSLTYSGFTTDGVTVNEDGSVTVSGLTAGSHIIKVENDGAATYQVICAKQTTVTITDSNGEEITVDNPADPGETVTVQLGSIYNPVNKLSGVYNSNCGIVYSGEDNKTFNGGRGSGFGYYLFAADPEVHKVSVTLPEVWADDTYSLTGYFSIGGNGKSAGAHRDLTYATGLEMDSNAPATAGLLGSLPQVDIPVNASERVAATEVTLNKTSLKINIDGVEMLTATVAPEGCTDSVSWTSSAPDIATVSKDGLVTGVAAGEAVITATAGDVSASCTVTVSAQTAVDLVLTTEAAYENEVYAPTMDFSEIVISGLVPSGTMTGVEVKDGKNVITDKTCTISLAPGEYESITITLKPLLGSVAQSAVSKLTYSCGDTTSNALSTYTDFAYTTSVTPVWENGQATLDLKLTLNGKNVRANYTINLVIEEGSTPEPATYTVTLPTETEGYTVAATEGSVSPVTEGGNYSFTVAISDGYEAGEEFAVKANDVVLTAVDGVYTIENITADQTVTVDGVVEKEEEPSLTWQEVMAKTEAYLTAQAENKAPIVGSTQGEWLVLGLARNEVKADFFDAYYANVVAYVAKNIDAETGRLHTVKSTDNSRIILALSALGKDVTDVGGYDLLQGLSDTDYVKKQGINGPVWALIALDSGNYDIPANADSDKQVTREWLVDYILDKELSGGGWGLAQTPDDMTPMAIQALAPYYADDAEVKEAVNRAMTVMTTMSATPETYAQMIVALSALGIDCETDEQFVVDGVSVLDKMLNYAMEDGSFQKSLTSGANQMSTEQAFYGMVAYDRFLDGKTSLYDMTDVIKDEGDVPGIEVENITLSESSASVKVGKNVTITAVVSPSDATDKTVTWTSSDTNIATVDNGTITGISKGTVTITATAGAHSATCTVTVTGESSGGSSGGSTGSDFGLSGDEIEGYVYVSFEDKGKRKANEMANIEPEFQSPLGTIIGRTKVPFKADDTIASVTLRLLDAKGFDASYEGDEFGSFYLEAIGDFTIKGTHYDSFGEFDAGQDSGWMITWNDWFIDQGASEFTVKDGDVIKWQYTCQLGADIGDDYFEREEGSISGGGGSSAVITSEDRASAKEVKDLISAIGTIDKDSAEAIKAARAAYDKLTDTQKELVPNYDELAAAEKAYAELTGVTIAPAEDTFADVKDHWAVKAIKYVADKGLMKGEGDNSFAPELATSRAMIATILYRLAGSPAVDGEASFADVADGAWYADAIRWAEVNNFVSGYADGSFGPNDNITREQLASILYRYAAANGHNMNAAAGLSQFADADTVGEWAITAMQWANAEGLITGKTGNVIDAKGNATRAEVATILMRYLENIAA